MCDLYFDSGKYRGPEDDPDGWHVRAVLGVKKDENVVTHPILYVQSFCKPKIAGVDCRYLLPAI